MHRYSLVSDGNIFVLPTRWLYGTFRFCGAWRVDAPLSSEPLLPSIIASAYLSSAFYSASMPPKTTKQPQKAFGSVDPAIALPRTLPVKRSHQATKKKVPKELRKNNKGWTEGSREEMLQRRLPGYLNTLEQSKQLARRELADIENEYWYIYQYPLPAWEEPTVLRTDYKSRMIVQPPATFSEEECEAWEAARRKVCLVSRSWYCYFF